MWSKFVTTSFKQLFDITICDNEYNGSKVADCGLRKFEMTFRMWSQFATTYEKIKFEVADCDLKERKGNNLTSQFVMSRLE
jgi:hypothetical protein